MEKPSCCKATDSFENFRPQVNSSFIENEPVSSSVLGENLEASSHWNNNEIFYKTINPRSPRITSKTAREKPKEKVPACCMSNVDPRPMRGKFLDETVRSLPVYPQGRGGSPSSKAFLNSIYQRYKRAREGTNNVTEPRRISDREPYPYNVTYNPRTHVPPASRNYRTYESSNFQPKFFSTQTSIDQRTKQFERTRGQNWSSINRTDLQPIHFSTPISHAQRGDAMRQDTYNVSKQPTFVSRYARASPTVDRLYTNPNLTRTVNPTERMNATFNYTQNPNISPYRQPRTNISGAGNRTFSNPHDESAYAQLADSEMPDETFRSLPSSQRPQSRQRQQEQSNYSRLANMADETIGRPQSAQTRSPNIQNRFPQVDTLYERPHSAGITSADRQLPACCRGGDQRPRTAQPFFEVVSEINQLPACCRRVDDRTRTINPSLKAKDNCKDNSCSKLNRSRKGACNNTTCSELQLVSDNTQTNFAGTNVGVQSGGSPPFGYSNNDIEGPLDTLLEIRTPHKATGAPQGSPFVLSINVSCADRSVVVTPDKGYKSISSYQT